MGPYVPPTPGTHVLAAMWCVHPPISPSSMGSCLTPRTPQPAGSLQQCLREEPALLRAGPDISTASAPQLLTGTAAGKGRGAPGIGGTPRTPPGGSPAAGAWQLVRGTHGRGVRCMLGGLNLGAKLFTLLVSELGEQPAQGSMLLTPLSLSPQSVPAAPLSRPWALHHWCPSWRTWTRSRWRALCLTAPHHPKAALDRVSTPAPHRKPAGR